MQTLGDLLTNAKELDSQKKDAEVFLKEVRFSPGKLVLPAPPGPVRGEEDLANDFFGSPTVMTDDTRAYAWSDHALRQAVEKLAGDPKPIPFFMGNYVGDEVKAEALASMRDRYSMRKLESGGIENLQWFVRCFKGVVRAVLNFGYPTFTDVTPFIETLMEYTANGGGHGVPMSYDVPYFNMDENRAHIELRWKPEGANLKIFPWGEQFDDPDNIYRYFISLRMDEVGLGKATVKGGLWRTTCANSITNRYGFELNHNRRWFGSGKELDGRLALNRHRIWAELKDEIGMAIGASLDLREQVVKAEEDAIPSIGQVIMNVCKARGYNLGVFDTAMKNSEIRGRDGTRLNVVHAFSAVAREADDPDARQEFSELAGDYLLSAETLRAHVRKGERMAVELEEPAI